MPWPTRRIREQFRSIWLSHSSPRRLAFGLALGVLIGSSPLWGFHTLIAVGLSLLFSLNKPAVLFGTLVSNPVSAPFLIFFSLEAGSVFLYGRPAHLSFREIKDLIERPEWHEVLKDFLLPYCVGSVLVGLVLAFLTFWVTLWFARAYRATDTNQ
jgi:uncharacterized protein (DUF2062 family)